MRTPSHLLVSTVIIGFMAPSSQAQLITPVDSGVVPQVYQAINYVRGNVGLPSDLNSNAEANPLQVPVDSYWRVLSSDHPSELVFVGITAGNINTVGVFPAGNPMGIIDVVPPQTGFAYTGDGSIGNPYPGGSNPLSETEFGFSLKSLGSGVFAWYSDASLNLPFGGGRQMLTYHLPDLSGKAVWIQTSSGLRQVTFGSASFLLTWEDIPAASSDSDYNDAIFMVSQVAPVPEPLTYALLMMTGPGALWWATRRK